MRKKTFTESQLCKALNLKREILVTLDEEEIIIPYRKRDERIYSAEQVEEIVFAIDLRRDMGVNWAGVDVALQMRRNMRDIMSRMNELLDLMRKRIESDSTDNES